jgi:hypothetical protein
MYQLDKGNDVVRQLIRLDMALARKGMQKAVAEYQKPIAAGSG